MAMNYEDEIRKFEAGAERVRASAPGLAALQRPVSTPSQRPAAAPLPTPSAGTRVGQGLRRAAPALAGAGMAAANQSLRSNEAALNVATSAPRAAGGFALDVAGGALGSPGPNAGNPIRPISLPRLGRPGAAAVASPAGPAGPAAALPDNWAAGARSRPAGAAPAASVAAPAAAAPTLARPSSTEFQLNPGDVNTFTGADGVTRAVPGLLNQPGSMENAAAAAPTQVATLNAPQYTPRGRQGAVIENPADSTVDKLLRAMGSASLKGSPSGRAAVAQAILGQERAQQDERAGALATGDRADLAAVNNQAAADQAFLQRRLTADQFNVGTAENRADREAERAARQPQVTDTTSGLGIVGQDGSFTPVTGQGGATLRAPQAPRQTGELTQGDRLKSYTERYNAIVGDVTADPEAKRTALAELDADPLYSSLRGGQPPISQPSLQQFLQAARAANPNVSEEDLTAYYNQNYGG